MPRYSPISAWLCIAAVFLFVSACGKAEEKQYGKLPAYISYKDVPGITKDEIKAIEELKAKQVSFIYGSLPGSEAFLDENGRVHGFSGLFCNWLTNVFGLPFIPKIYAWDKLISGLKDGSIDFTGELTAIEDRKKDYFMTDAIAERTLATVRMKGSAPFNEIAEQRPLKFIFLEGSNTYNNLKKSIAYDTIETISASDYADAYNKLKNEEADVFFEEKPSESYFSIYSDLIVEDILPLIHSPVSLTTQDKEHEVIISVVQKILQKNGVLHLAKMYHEGYREYLKNKFLASLNEEERNYIKNQHVIPFAAETSNYPVSFYDARAKEWNGMAIDILNIVEYFSGLKFKIVNDKDDAWPVTKKMLEDGEAFMISELIQSEERENLFIWPKTMFLHDKFTLISRMDIHNISLNEISYMRVGLAKNLAYTEAFKKWFPNHVNNIEYQSIDLAFNALDQGEVDLVMSSMHQILRLTNYLELTDYKANFVFDFSYESTFGFNKNQPVLCSIIDKALKLIDTENISNQWMHKNYNYSVNLRKSQIPWFIAGIALISAFIILAILFIIKQHEKQRLEGIAYSRTAEVIAIYSSIPDIIFTMDTKLVYTSCNPSFEKFTGLKLEDVIGKTDAEIFSSAKHMSKMSKLMMDTAKQVIESMEPVTYQESMPNSEGEEVIFETVKAPLFQDNKLTGLIAIARDITAHKNAEKEALEASKAKSIFLANMSHEIRTPMNVIIGMSDLLSHEQLNKRQMNYVEDISLSARSLLAIINDILDMSKIEAGKLTLNPVDYDLKILLDNIKSMFEFVAHNKDIEFKFECKDEVPEYLFGDDIRLRQVLTNICGNAIKFTESGYVKLKVSKSSDGSDSLLFEISDTGTGIRKEDISSLFNAFSQADTFKNRGIVGTGLGLSISKSFIEMMGGKIIVESEYGQGTVFMIMIPIVKGSKEKIERMQKEKREQNLSAPDADVLVVDDNEFNLKVACGLLGLLKIKAQTTTSGKNAIELVQQQKFDIVLMDHMMPEMDGIEATSKIRKLGKEYENLPIIALTANAVQGAKEMFLSNGFNGFVSKPIDVHALNSVLLEWLPPEKIDSENKVEKTVVVENNYLESLGEIDEVNTKIGLSNFSDVESMYIDIFKLFCKDIINKCTEMSVYLNNNDLQKFSIAVHSMKSSLATVGVMGLSEMASDLETASKNNDMDYCAKKYPDFEEKLLLLQKLLSGVFPASEMPAEKKPGDKEHLKKSIQKAIVAANDLDNFTGSETIKDLLTYDYGEKLNASLESVILAFDELDFDKAIENLNKINC